MIIIVIYCGHIQTILFSNIKKSFTMEFKEIAKEFSKHCTTLLPPQEMTALIVKHIHPITPKPYEGTKCVEWLNQWAEINKIEYKFRFVTSGGMYSNPRVKGWNPNADGSLSESNSIFYEYRHGNAWVGSTEMGIIIETL